MGCLCLAVAPCHGQEPIGSDTGLLAELEVHNAFHAKRREVVRVAVPFARGRARDLSRFAVQGHATAWQPLTRWPDGTHQWAQAQFVAVLPGFTSRRYAVTRGPGAIPPSRAFRAGPRLTRLLARKTIRTEVEDPFGVVYEARLCADPTAGPDGLLASSPLVRIYRFRDYHIAADPKRTSLGRDYLSLTAYLTLFHGFEHAELLIVLGNDYLGSDDPQSDDPNLYPLGTVRLRRFSLVVEDPALAFVPRLILENGLRPPEEITDERGQRVGWRQHLLGPADGMYLGDGCIKPFPCVLYARAERTGADSDERLRRQTATAIAQQPLFGLPDAAAVRASRALNAHGGPAPATPGARALAVRVYADFLRRPHFGPFGTWGDVPFTTTTGTPRNATIGLPLAVRSGSPELLAKAEAFCLQQGLRPYHLFGLEVPADRDILLEGMPKFRHGAWVSADSLGRRSSLEATKEYRRGLYLPIGGPHGRNPFDYEHFTVDVLYDFYCLTGSAFARDELRVLGEQLKGMLRPENCELSRPSSTRGEGWCMKALVLCWLATGDDGLKQHAIQRLPALEAALGKPPHTYAVAQAPDDRALGAGVPWDAPWQQAAYVMGMAAAHRYFGEVRFRRLALDVARFMAHQGWLDGVGPKYFVAVDNPKRFTLPQTHGPLEGTALFEVPAFVLAADLAAEARLPAERATFLERARTIVAAHAGSGVEMLAADKWLQIYLDRFPPAELRR